MVWNVCNQAMFCNSNYRTRQSVRKTHTSQVFVHVHLWNEDVKPEIESHVVTSIGAVSDHWFVARRVFTCWARMQLRQVQRRWPLPRDWTRRPYWAQRCPLDWPRPPVPSTPREVSLQLDWRAPLPSLRPLWQCRRWPCSQPWPASRLLCPTSPNFKNSTLVPPS